MTSELFSPLSLPSGQVLGNRIAKAAMEENLADDGQLPGHRLRELYRRWAAGGSGLLITGNVMVHAEALTGPAGVVLDEAAPLEPFTAWAEAARSGGGAAWMQINHPGRQVPAGMPGVVWGPSAVGLDLGRHSGRFGRPVAMTPEQIEATVARFAVTARRAEQAGFDGVEIHAAHGYLLSQFLSPLVNRRTDAWGGSLENRARMLLDVVRAVRDAVSSSFAVAVKLNSADFQRGGFDAGDARQVIGMLAPLGVDLVEVSGGSYESPAMTGRPADERTRAREAYFLDLARDLARTSPVPLMLTGGITGAGPPRTCSPTVWPSSVWAPPWPSPRTCPTAGGTAARPTGGYGRSPGPTRRSPRPRAWPRSATRCAASRTAGRPGPAPTPRAPCCANRAANGEPCAATAPG